MIIALSLTLVIVFMTLRWATNRVDSLVTGDLAVMLMAIILIHATVGPAWDEFALRLVGMAECLVILYSALK